LALFTATLPGIVRSPLGYDIVNTTAFLQHDRPVLFLAGKKSRWHFRFLEKFGLVSCGLSQNAVPATFRTVAVALDETRGLLEKLRSRVH
jgi:serine/threonine-protein kinase HipA